MSNPEHEVVEHKVRRAMGVHALRKIGKIVAEERQADSEKARVLNWSVRYGWLIALCIVLIFAYAKGII